MSILFGLLVLILLAAGLYLQRRQRKTWVKEERYEESGNWIDKRSGERGTYGSLDAQREQERKTLTDQGRANELARLLRDYFFEHYPGFANLNNDQLKAFTAAARNQASQLFQTASSLQKGQSTDPHEAPDSETEHTQPLKKIMLDFSYQAFPALLDLELEQIKQFDRAAASGAAHLVKTAGQL
ncbi:MAG: hypothetical protein H6574_16395 [Lewinellaceae bacterium]|nr:hypothetical protein [Saprospiraceae bacterium]MCB9332654.1 hypothetical protein [Lewinellaceae bacterium]